MLGLELFLDKILVEISKIGRNSVIPGGKTKINERTNLTIKREILEEMNFDITVDKLNFKKVIENFFEFDTIKVHELYFLYEYMLADTEYSFLRNIKDNKDNSTTYFEFISINKLDTKKTS